MPHRIAAVVPLIFPIYGIFSCLPIGFSKYSNFILPAFQSNVNPKSNALQGI